MSGCFITFEGIDGSGKSTQLRALVETLRAQGHDVVATCEPGGTSLGQALRKAFLDTDGSVAPTAELLLFAADRAQHIEHLIRPAILDGKIIISDRYADATRAYQGAGRGFDRDLIETIIEIATGGLRPDLTLFFDIPVERALERTSRRRPGARNRMDGESADFYTRVRKAYLDLADAEPARFRVVDADREVDVIASDVMKLVKECISGCSAR